MKYIIATLLSSLFVFAQDPLTIRDVQSAEKMFGLQFTDAKRESLLSDIQSQLASYRSLRSHPLGNAVIPSVLFNPIPHGFIIPDGSDILEIAIPSSVSLPKRMEDLAFYSIPDLASLIKNKKITSEQLTRFFIDRIKKYNPVLQCVITLTDSLAILQAQRADKEIASGKYRGMLHGIPYGAKDLLAVKGYRTTWGAMPYKDQMIDMNATVITRLEEAGAVLIAKTSLGALAWGDVWFGGRTRNPWKLEQGSSGSSAGSASGTAAGLFPFAIGSETYGSIVSPSARCGTTGLRPSYGMVSRNGAMALSWTMDKLGPICRSAEDCAIVLQAIHGTDKADPTLYPVPFRYQSSLQNIRSLRIGFVQSEFDSLRSDIQIQKQVLSTLREMGVTLIPVKLPSSPIDDMVIMLSAEAAAAFDDLTLSGKDSLLVRQIKNAWPNAFRAARFIPAVEYLQASRLRTQLINEMNTLMDSIDVFVGPSLEGNNLLLTNLTGHPSITLPCGFRADGTPVSITFTGRLFEDGTVTAVAAQFQRATTFHTKHPLLPR